LIVLLSKPINCRLNSLAVACKGKRLNTRKVDPGILQRITPLLRGNRRVRRKGKAGSLLPSPPAASPTATEVTSWSPSTVPQRSGVRICGCRIGSRCRVDRIFVHHNRRRSYDYWPANNDGLADYGSRFHDNDRRRRPVFVRVNLPVVAGDFAVGMHRKIRRDCRRGEGQGTGSSQDRFTHVVLPNLSPFRRQRGNPLLGPLTDIQREASSPQSHAGLKWNEPELIAEAALVGGSFISAAARHYL
jgi:hypothetical protein